MTTDFDEFVERELKRRRTNWLLDCKERLARMFEGLYTGEEDDAPSDDQKAKT